MFRKCHEFICLPITCINNNKEKEGIVFKAVL